ncbi:hypothetical protein V2J09_002811 [Rumex salicifolius]
MLIYLVYVIIRTGEKKLSKVIVPDKWKEGASNTNESGGRKINENKLLSKKKRFAIFSFVGLKLGSQNDENGHRMAKPHASSASSRCTKTASIVILVLTVKAYVQCAVSKYWTQKSTNRAMYDTWIEALVVGCCFSKRSTCAP